MRRGATGAGGINRSGLRDQSPAQMRGSRNEADRNGRDNLHPPTANRHLVGGLPPLTRVLCSVIIPSSGCAVNGARGRFAEGHAPAVRAEATCSCKDEVTLGDFA
jgi:hypothetical protein